MSLSLDPCPSDPPIDSHVTMRYIHASHTSIYIACKNQGLRSSTFGPQMGPGTQCRANESKTGCDTPAPPEKDSLC